MNTTSNNREYWKSLDEKYETPEFVEAMEKEFQSSPFKTEEEKGGLARRQFMKLMGASVAMSTAACVRRPVQKIIPYVDRPKDVVPGIANFYASALQVGPEVFPVTIKTREGRPLHIEGLSKGSQGRRGLSVQASSQILNLYDPDRIRKPTVNSQNPKKRGKKISVGRTWENLDKKVVEKLKGSGVEFLLNGSASPTLNDLVRNFASQFNIRVNRWSGFTAADEAQAFDKSYGQNFVPRLDPSRADFILSIDGDFLGVGVNATENQTLFAKNRTPDDGQMSRLVSFHSVQSLTSMNADDQYSIRPTQQLPLVLGLLHELLFVQGQGSSLATAEVRQVTEPFEKIYLALGMDHSAFSKLVKDLARKKGGSLVVASSPQSRTRDGVQLQIAVNLLNQALGNMGSTVLWQNPQEGAVGDNLAIGGLIERMKAGEVKTLLIDEMNPVYFLPDAAGFKAALGKVETVISLSNWMDETASMADLVAPKGHSLENWGDLISGQNQVSIQQPTIEPLYETRSFGDSLMVWAKAMGQSLGSAENYYEHLRQKWVGHLGSESQWLYTLQKGSLSQPTSKGSGAFSFNFSALADFPKTYVEPEDPGLELAVYSKVGIGDGQLANVSWLQELPDPVSKICWDNYLHVSPKKAKELGLSFGDMVRVSLDSGRMSASEVSSSESGSSSSGGEGSSFKANGVFVNLPVYISPGTNENTVAVAMGYGRTLGGEICEGVGFSISPLMGWSDNRAVLAGQRVRIEKTGEMYPLAQTQGHHSLEGRQIIGETSLPFYKGHGSVGIHKHPTFSIWNKHSYDGHKWGMGIDLSSCNGCSACMVSCQSENNIPVVGKKNVLHGREMHWIRIDRYFNGDENNSPDTVFQPVTCQHCENAPCETVCPVLATVHSDEGLNDMVYNRCVGTRYCSNNCPYKVRRFNWFYYDSHHKKAPLHMALNPEVTVRSRGVMEKCTFCVQRIKDAKNTAKDEDRSLRDGDIKTACESACPTGAIVFGDLNDPNSRVSQWFKNKREYTLLEEFNAAPRVRYLAKIRNTDRLVGHGGSHGGGSHGSGHGDDHQGGH